MTAPPRPGCMPPDLGKRTCFLSPVTYPGTTTDHHHHHTRGGDPMATATPEQDAWTEGVDCGAEFAELAFKAADRPALLDAVTFEPPAYLIPPGASERHAWLTGFTVGLAGAIENKPHDRAVPRA